MQPFVPANIITDSSALTCRAKINLCPFNPLTLSLQLTSASAFQLHTWKLPPAAKSCSTFKRIPYLISMFSGAAAFATAESGQHVLKAARMSLLPPYGPEVRRNTCPDNPPLENTAKSQKDSPNKLLEM